MKEGGACLEEEGCGSVQRTDETLFLTSPVIPLLATRGHLARPSVAAVVLVVVVGQIGAGEL